MASRKPPAKKPRQAKQAAQPKAQGDAPPQGAPKRKTRLRVIDDHPLVRERMAELINGEPDLLVCGEAEDVNGALAAAKSLAPDMAIVDITLKDAYGIELVKQLKELYPKLLMLVLSMHEESM